MSAMQRGKARVIAVAGKGGVGKSTLAALIVRYLKENTDGPILALDADPDANLASLLGVAVERTLGDLREDTLKGIKDFPAGMSKPAYIEAGLHEIVEETDKVDILTMGRGEGPACYCAVNNLLRKFSDELMPSYAYVVMDNEAGLEHLSRRTASRIDDLIVVVNANPHSTECAARIDSVAEELGANVRRRHYVVNAVPPEHVEEVKERMVGLSLAFLGVVPPDDSLVRASLRGDDVYALDGGPAVLALAEIMKTLGAL